MLLGLEEIACSVVADVHHLEQAGHFNTLLLCRLLSPLQSVPALLQMSPSVLLLFQPSVA